MWKPFFVNIEFLHLSYGHLSHQHAPYLLLLQSLLCITLMSSWKLFPTQVETYCSFIFLPSLSLTMFSTVHTKWRLFLTYIIILTLSFHLISPLQCTCRSQVFCHNFLTYVVHLWMLHGLFLTAVLNVYILGVFAYLFTETSWSCYSD